MCATKSLRKAKSRLPLWGRCPPVGGGEGSVKPPSRCATGREKRFAVSLVSLWLAPTKVKGKVKVETFLKKSFIKKLYARFARPSFHFFHLYL